MIGGAYRKISTADTPLTYSSRTKDGRAQTHTQAHRRVLCNTIDDQVRLPQRKKLAKQIGRERETSFSGTLVVQSGWTSKNEISFSRFLLLFLFFPSKSTLYPIRPRIRDSRGRAQQKTQEKKKKGGGSQVSPESPPARDMFSLLRFPPRIFTFFFFRLAVFFLFFVTRQGSQMRPGGGPWGGG